MNVLEEARMLKEMIRGIVKSVVKEETRSCFRVYKAKVVRAPYRDEEKGDVCAVRINGDNTILVLPYSSKTAGMAVGDAVLVATVFDSFRNAIVWETRNFK